MYSIFFILRVIRGIK